MTLLEVLVQWAGASSSLDLLLKSAGTRVPELRPAADEWLAKLSQAVTVENLAGVASALPREAQDILRGKLNPQDRPSDFA